jgi:hypothetical protein
LALLANVALAAYHFNRIYKNKLNPLKDEVYTETVAYRKVIEENR